MQFINFSKYKECYRLYNRKSELDDQILCKLFFYVFPYLKWKYYDNSFEEYRELSSEDEKYTYNIKKRYRSESISIDIQYKNDFDFYFYSIFIKEHSPLHEKYIKPMIDHLRLDREFNEYLEHVLNELSNIRNDKNNNSSLKSGVTNEKISNR